MKITTFSAFETLSFGEKIARDLLPGDLILLKGDLGAGKTTLTQGIAKGLNAKQSPTSPSFTIMQDYVFPNGIFRHIDLYRLQDSKLEIDTMGLPELLTDEKAVTAVEWPERLHNMWERKGRIVEIVLSYGIDPQAREIEVKF